jgi:catechol 2,3-dioxygenase-like lactoylglutathione lyase family enzyme
VFEDDVSAAFQFENALVNVLARTEAPELIEPAQVAPSGSGAPLLLTIWADDVEAACRELQARGVELLNGPVDRPWGVRTAAFADPDGHSWELAQQLGG